MSRFAVFAVVSEAEQLAPALAEAEAAEESALSSAAEVAAASFAMTGRWKGAAAREQDLLVAVRAGLVARATQGRGRLTHVSNTHTKALDAESELACSSLEQLRALGSWLQCVRVPFGALHAAFTTLPLLLPSAHSKHEVDDTTQLLKLQGAAGGLVGFPTPQMLTAELDCAVVSFGGKTVVARGTGLDSFTSGEVCSVQLVLSELDGARRVRWATEGDLQGFVYACGSASAVGAVAAGGCGSSLPVAGSRSLREASAAAAGGGPVATFALADAAQLESRIHINTQGLVTLEYQAPAPHDSCEELFIRLQLRGVFLNLTGCAVLGGGVALAGTALIVRRKHPPTSHTCEAQGQHVGTFAIEDHNDEDPYLLAVSQDESLLLISYERCLSVYSLPEGTLQRKLGKRLLSRSRSQFGFISGVCFGPGNAVIIADSVFSWLKVLTPRGTFVKLIGAGSFGSGSPWCVTACDDLIAVGGQIHKVAHKVVLFSFPTGDVLAQFGTGSIPKCLLASERCSIQLTPDGKHLVLAESFHKRLSVFTTTGEFVKCVHVDNLPCWDQFSLDVVVSARGEMVVLLEALDGVYVYDWDSGRVLRSWGSFGEGPGHFMAPSAMAVAGAHLYVLDTGNARVQLFL